jgi:cytochrome P450
MMAGTNLSIFLNLDMIYAQGVLFFAAGFETTSNALATLAYNLARHPDIQVNLDFVLTLTLIYIRM